jgi:L,D-peptidoglycan transpeptidase YkuD (ErfK/YbiS/YcfS/YnhG family)
MDLIVKPGGWLMRGEAVFRCALGGAGISAAKQEGDGATPAGTFALRRLYYRADRVPAPVTGLPALALSAGDGWCDDPACAAYNSLVSAPHQGSHETLWRADALYDILVVIGHNDDPPIAGNGSGIFLHVAATGYAPTKGCVALALDNLVAVIADCDPSTRLTIMDSG